MCTDVWSCQNEARKPHTTRLYEIRSLFWYIEQVSKTWPLILGTPSIWHFRKDTKYCFRKRAVGEQTTLMIFLRHSPIFHWFVLRVHAIMVSKFGTDNVNMCTGSSTITVPCVDSVTSFCFVVSLFLCRSHYPYYQQSITSTSRKSIWTEAGTDDSQVCNAQVCECH